MNNNEVITANLNEMIFEGRNQQYGGYVIRKNFNRRMIISLVAISALVLVLVFIGLMAPVKKGGLDSLNNGIVELVNIPILPEPEEVKVIPPVELEEEKPLDEPATQPEDNTVPEPEPQENNGMDTKESKVPTPDPNASDDKSIASNDEFKDKNPGLEDNDDNQGKTIGNPPGDNLEPVKPKTTVIPDPDPMEFFAGKMPEAKNLDEIKKKVNYPGILREAGMEGKVIFRVLVGPDGKYKKHIVKRSAHPEFTKACERQIKNLTFSPGMENGKPVKVWVTIPFKFTLSK